MGTITATIGFIKLDYPYPEYLDQGFIKSNLTQNNFGVDPVQANLLIGRISEDIDLLDKDQIENNLIMAMEGTANRVIRWLTQNEKTEGVILSFQTKQEKWDIRIFCNAYRQSV